jgi:hypothetical protein
VNILVSDVEFEETFNINFYNRTRYIQLDGEWNLLHRQPGNKTKEREEGLCSSRSLHCRLAVQSSTAAGIISGPLSPKSIGDDADGGDNDDDNDNGDTAPKIPLHVLVSATDPRL